MEPQTCKLARRDKAQLIWRYLRGVVKFFILAVLFACLSMAFNALTPQIIKLTVDSILGSEEASLGVFSRFVSMEWFRFDPVRSLWIAAGLVMLVAVLRGFFAASGPM